MSFNLVFQPEPEYLLVTITGYWTTRAAEDAIDTIYSQARKTNLTWILIDITQIPQPDHEMTRFFTGDYWANVFGDPFRAAFVMDPDVYNGFGENVALNRGAIVKIFHEQQPALRWLRVA
jgi:hypothetical protein